MRIMVRNLTIVAAMGVVALFAVGDAQAACGSAVIFGQFTAGCGGAFCYVTTPGAGTIGSVFGTFWDLGGGNPTVGVGNDNGSYADNGWLVAYGPGFYMSGNPGWQTPGVDGCVEPTDSMVAGFSDESADGSTGYFAVACVLRNPAVATQFDFTTIGENIALVPLPKPTIVSSVRNLTNTDDFDVTVAAPDFSAGFYSDGSPGCTQEAVISQYDVYKQELTRGAGGPTDRDAGWVLAGTFAAGVNGTITTTCGTTECTVYLGVAPRYDSGFGTGDGDGPRRVGDNSTRVDAGPNLADPGDRKFKMIDRKDLKKGQSKK